jgi:hypothetical protein
MIPTLLLEPSKSGDPGLSSSRPRPSSCGRESRRRRHQTRLARAAGRALERVGPSDPDATIRAVVEPSDKPFGDALRELLLADGDIYVSAGGNVKWATFAHVLHGVSYDILRRTVRGDRPPSVELMEECARVLQVWPTYFAEYRAIGFARRAA